MAAITGNGSQQLKIQITVWWGGLGPFEGRREPFAEVVVGQYQDIVAGPESGVPTDGEQPVVTHDEPDPHVDRQVCEFFDGAAVGR